MRLIATACFALILTLPLLADASRELSPYPAAGCVILDPEKVAETEARVRDGQWTEINYPRFDVFIDTAYYSANAADLDTFLMQFEPRLNLLESITGWSAERFHDGERLEI